MGSKTKVREGIVFSLKCLLFVYLMTGLLLLLLAALLYRFQLSEQAVSIGILLIYVAAAFTAGLITGKRQKEKRYLWGLGMGTAYFLVLAGLSLAVSHSVGDLASDFMTVLILCACSGMLGGMLS